MKLKRTVPSVKPFDPDVKVGDIRIFGEAKRPFVALIVEAKGLLGYRVVPVSPNPCAVSNREIELGGRVYQLWNECAMARAFAVRSWVVDSLCGAELEAVRAAVPSAMPGRVTAGDSAQAVYERENLVDGGMFKSIAGSKASRIVGGSSARGGILPRMWTEAWKIAASFAICLGTFYFILGSGRERIREWGSRFYSVAAYDEGGQVELVEAEPEKAKLPEIGEKDTVFNDFGPEALVARGDVWQPVLRCGSTAEAEIAARSLPVALTEEVRRLAALRFRPIELPNAAEFVDPAELPRSVLETGAAKASASVVGAGGAMREAAEEDAAKAGVECFATECPWNARAMLLNVRAHEVSDGSVEVVFDKESVGGYRIVEGGGTRPLNAWYEVMPRRGGPLGEGFCRVAVRTRAGGGEAVPVRIVDGGALAGVPTGAGGASSGDDGMASPRAVPVEVIFQKNSVEKQGEVFH